MYTSVLSTFPSFDSDCNILFIVCVAFKRLKRIFSSVSTSSAKRINCNTEWRFRFNRFLSFEIFKSERLTRFEVVREGEGEG